jgi:hypothetical protein
MTQEERVLRHLESGQTITALESLPLFNCLRLAAVVHRLRQEGHSIETEMVTTRSGKRIARYRMLHDAPSGLLFPGADEPADDLY